MVSFWQGSVESACTASELNGLLAIQATLLCSPEHVLNDSGW
jgi:hypothetical protein